MVVFEEALIAHPTGRMYALYSEYLQDCLSQQSTTTQPEVGQLLPSQQATAEQLLQVYKRASEAGEPYLWLLLTYTSLVCTALTCFEL